MVRAGSSHNNRCGHALRALPCAQRDMQAYRNVGRGKRDQDHTTRWRHNLTGRGMTHGEHAAARCAAPNQAPLPLWRRGLAQSEPLSRLPHASSSPTSPQRTPPPLQQHDSCTAAARQLHLRLQPLQPLQPPGAFGCHLTPHHRPHRPSSRRCRSSVTAAQQLHPRRQRLQPQLEL